MPEGPLGGPRPLATGSVILIVTTEKASLLPSQYQRALNIEGLIQDSFGSVSVDLDESVNSYGIDTGLDAVSMGDLKMLESKAKENYLGLEDGDRVKGVQVGFR